MEEQKMTGQESIELIARMINRTRQRLELGRGNIFLFWGYLIIAVTILKWISGYLCYLAGLMPEAGRWLGWIWFLIPLIGCPVTVIQQRKRRQTSQVRSYSDVLSDKLWRFVIYLAIAGLVISFGFFVVGFPIWIIMMLYAFFVIGFATSVQGMIIHEKSLVYGGAFGMIMGGFLTASLIAGLRHLIQTGISPLLIITYIIMFIIPGYIINRKARKVQQS